MYCTYINGLAPLGIPGLREEMKERFYAKQKCVGYFIPFSQYVQEKLGIDVSSLSDVERDLLKLITEFDDVCKAGELSERFIEKTGSSKGSFSRALEKLEFVRLIDTKYTGKGVRGNSREIILRFNPDDYVI